MFTATLVSYLVGELHRLPPTSVYVLVAVLVFGEAALFVGFVLPGETAVLVGGVVAREGHVNVVALALLVVAAAVLGDSIGYEVGQRWGRRLIELPIIRRRRAAIDRALEGLERRGATYVFVGRFTAFLRAVMPGLAGMSALPYPRFLAANAAGAVLWGVGYTLLGYFAGGALNSIERVSGWATLGLLILVVGALVLWHVLRKRHDERLDAAWRARPEDDSAQRGE